MFIMDANAANMPKHTTLILYTKDILSGVIFALNQFSKMSVFLTIDIHALQILIMTFKIMQFPGVDS